MNTSGNLSEPVPWERCSLPHTSPLTLSYCLFLLAPVAWYSSLLTESTSSPRDVALPVGAKLLAAGGATCAYQIAAKAVAFPESLLWGIGEGRTVGAAVGWIEERAFLWALLWGQNCEVGFQMVEPPLSASPRNHWAQRQPRDLWVPSLAFRWANMKEYFASRPLVELLRGYVLWLCSWGFLGFLITPQDPLASIMSILFGLVLCIPREQFFSFYPHLIKGPPYNFGGRKWLG